MDSLDVARIKKDFPILERVVNDKQIVYLDNAATTQKPTSVIEKINDYNRFSHANPHRGAHILSVESTKIYDDAKEKVKSFINAHSTEEIIFTRNTTESLNLIAQSYGREFIEKGDEIVITISSHHSNILPWQRIAKEKDAILKYLYLDKDGRLPMEEVYKKITKKTKLLSIEGMSNVLGTIHPLKEIIKYAHNMGTKVIVDGAQSVPHIKIDVKDLDADFLVFSAHKMLGPMGIGVLYGKKEILESMPPFLLGGDMIEYVSEQDSSFAPLPFKFEAGTQNVEGAAGLLEAINYLENIGIENIKLHEEVLTQYTLEKMMNISYLDIQGPLDMENRGGIISFTIKDVHPHDTATILDSYGIAIRSGHHCAQPLMHYMGVPSTSRVSFYLYNTLEDADKFLYAIKNVRKWLGYGS
ncbi:cysteine desulfurase [Tissierella creatinophila]|uniref:cysteine desulfurase n=1 Tax=Tissierella creatinophila DSM 6911 TaxID=1123403 RepID=A0A1U7M8Q5_TISCR|nr:cysteine desulfurase [Tissierella creatinophila]OLS03665.1 cysteine desulfurase SufS [Tissierella creatinophila DSM 6911]